ncbi:MAG TPA: hypothetical protein VN721_12870 [Flavipsychrobacter sp.]|nr:hypothetical protein [Flavipsychrobacter sp.]
MKKALFILSCSLMFFCCKKNDEAVTQQPVNQNTSTSSISNNKPSANVLLPKNPISTDTQAYSSYSGVLYQYCDADDFANSYSDTNFSTVRLNMPLGDTVIIANPYPNTENLFFSKDNSGVYTCYSPRSFAYSVSTFSVTKDSLVFYVQYGVGCFNDIVHISFKGRKI